MSPSLNSEIVSMNEVPFQDVEDDTSRRRVVLVVDDEPLVADTLSIILSRAGYITMTAYDAQTALELAETMAPDLMISDVAMPERNGVELAIAMLGSRPKCQVLLFSGHATSDDLVQAFDAGHNFHLIAKPVHPTVMLRLVSRALGIPQRKTWGIHLAEIIPIRRFA